MNKLIFFSAAVLVLSSCSKSETGIPVIHPEMNYINLNNSEIIQGRTKSVDIDADGHADFVFETLLVGDPLLKQDKLQYYATSRIEDYLLNNDQEETPGYNKNDQIGFQHPGYEWNHISALLLAEKVTGITEPPFWRGNWKDADHRYLPVMIKRNGQDYLEWIELSFQTQTGKLILHRAAVSKKAGVAIRAGI